MGQGYYHVVGISSTILSINHFAPRTGTKRVQPAITYHTNAFMRYLDDLHNCFFLLIPTFSPSRSALHELHPSHHRHCKQRDNCCREVELIVRGLARANVGKSACRDYPQDIIIYEFTTYRDICRHGATIGDAFTWSYIEEKK